MLAIRRVWLSRTKHEAEEGGTVDIKKEQWKPLRKTDIKILNNAQTENGSDNHHPILIESGRATADPEFGIVRSNFVPRPLRELTSCTWFAVVEERKDPNTGTLQPVLDPLPDNQSEKVEEMYQRALYAGSMYGGGIEPMLKEQVDLDGTQYHVEVCNENGGYTMKKVYNGWFSKSLSLQRGRARYVSEGEEEEEMLGPVSHAIFIVHGIGETYFSKDKTSSMVEQVDQFRLIFQRRQIADWKKKCDVAKKKKEPNPNPPNRVEFLPILWYDRIHSTSNSMTKSLNSVTLNTIPALRSIANDVVLDVLLYLTPNYCCDVLESVTDQIFSVYGVFNKIFPDFSSRGGKFSLIGHSLGSVICWDLLSLKKNLIENNDDVHGVHIAASKTKKKTVGFNSPPVTPTSTVGMTENSSDSNDYGTWGPSLPKTLDRVIPFEPDFTIFVGSPIGLFLSLRGAHSVFDSIRDAHPQKPKVSPFTLPTKRMYNIFSPSDPVAYRIEPLFLAQGTEKLPDPLYLTRLGEGVRLHIRAMQLGDEIKKKSRSWFSSVSKPSSQGKLSTTEVLTLENGSKEYSNTTSNPTNNNTSTSSDDNDKLLTFPLGGKSSRLDYQLQPSVIDNEYISAVTAHSTYFCNTDIIDFVIDVASQEQHIVIDLTIDENDKNATMINGC